MATTMNFDEVFKYQRIKVTIKYIFLWFNRSIGAYERHD
jgi:hypothetical protein